MKRIINSGECEHCEGKVIYENERFKLEMTKRGRVWELYGGCSPLEAADTYYRSKDEDNSKKTTT